MENWSYQQAFGRNLGLISETEQEKLRTTRVAIAGMGGVGGIHLITLVRLGIGKFTITDPDAFDVANTNRQYGAATSVYGRNKAEVMAEIAKDINPQVDITIIPGGVTEKNVGEFLKEADLFVDGLDIFALDARRFVYKAAAEQGIYAISAGPLGFSTSWMVFDPSGMSFDEYFDVRDTMSEAEKFIAFVVGGAPAGTHLRYIDKTKVDFKERRGPSVGFACDLAAGVVGAETIKILLGRGTIWPAPYYQQFDPYLGKLVRGKLRGGNKHPWQRLKRWYLLSYARKHNMI